VTLRAKLLAALAALPVASTPLAADPPKATASVYGTLNVNLQTTKATGAAAGAAANVKERLAVSVDSSNVGVRGAITLNEWIGGVAQCETGANVDGIAGAALCNRNSRVGLTGLWGTFFYGNWDTPYKTAAWNTKADDPFGNTDVHDAASIITSPGFSTTTGPYSTASSTAITRFSVRGQNAVAYHSPNWMGLSGKVHYTINEFKNPSGTQSPELFSAGLNWESGKFTAPVPCSVFVTIEQHKDGYGLVGMNGTARAFGATVANTAGTATAALHTTDTGLRGGLGCGYDWDGGSASLGGVYEQLVYEQNGAPAGALKEYKRNAWQVGGKARFSNHEIRARYSVADKGSATIAGGAASNTDGYGASMLALGYGYYIVPDALQAYLFYTQISNDRNAQYTFGTAGATTVTTPTPAGADPFAVGLGLRLAF